MKTDCWCTEVQEDMAGDEKKTKKCVQKVQDNHRDPSSL